MNGGKNESQSGHSEAKCQLQAVRSFSNPTLNTLEVIRRFRHGSVTAYIEFPIYMDFFFLIFR